MMLVQVFELGRHVTALVGRKPGRQRRRLGLRRAKLAQRHADIGAGEALIADRDHRGILAAGDGGDHPPLERDEFGIAEHVQHALEGVVARRIERPRAAKRVLGGMGRIEMRTGDPAVRDLLGGGVRAAMPQKLRQHVRMRTVGALAVGIGYRLIDLDPPDPAEKHAMRARRHDHPDRRIVGLEQRPPLLRA